MASRIRSSTLNLPINGEGDATDQGTWDGNSSLLLYTVQVPKDGKSFTGTGSYKIIEGPDPYDANATVLFNQTGITLTGKKIAVDKSALPPL